MDLFPHGTGNYITSFDEQSPAWMKVVKELNSKLSIENIKRSEYETLDRWILIFTDRYHAAIDT